MRTYVAPDELEGNKLLKESYEKPSLGTVYQGIVRDNKDPQKLGRIKVYIPNLYSGLSTERLPWAQPCLFSASYESGTFIIPKVGNAVWVLFENNDQFRPVYIGSKYIANSNRVKQAGDKIQSANASAVPLIATGENVELLFKSENGSSIYFSEGGVNILSPNGVGLKIDDSSIDLVNTSGSNIKAEDDTLELSFGKTKIVLNGSTVRVISGSSTITVNSDSIDLDSTVGKVSIGKSISVETGNASINVNNGSVVTKAGSTTVRQSGSTVDINASTVNINASYINM